MRPIFSTDWLKRHRLHKRVHGSVVVRLLTAQLIAVSLASVVSSRKSPVPTHTTPAPRGTTPAQTP